jgi:hypothetical protein
MDAAHEGFAKFLGELDHVDESVSIDHFLPGRLWLCVQVRSGGALCFDVGRYEDRYHRNTVFIASTARKYICL